MTNRTLDLDTLIDTHLAAYAEPDAAHRAPLVAQVWNDEGELIDPPFDGRGHEAIGAMADTVLAHYPGHTFERTTVVDEHHGFARYGWALLAPDGTPAVTGTDFVKLDDAGRIRQILGFFGDLEPKAG